MAAVIILIAGGLLVGLYREASPVSVTSHATSSSFAYSSSVSHLIGTTSANSTYTFTCPHNSTCDFFLSLVINVTCTGCSFSGEYVGPSSDSKVTHVSGSGTGSYYVSSFDSPLRLAWNISKDSSGGTLEVKVGEQSGPTYYDKLTNIPFGYLTGEWNVDELEGF
jgi:activator of HSP90 ATPase